MVSFIATGPAFLEVAFRSNIVARSGWGLNEGFPPPRREEARSDLRSFSPRLHLVDRLLGGLPVRLLAPSAERPPALPINKRVSFTLKLPLGVDHPGPISSSPDEGMAQIRERPGKRPKQAEIAVLPLRPKRR